MICSWLRGHQYELFYRFIGTSSKDYLLLASDVEVMEMVTKSIEGGRVEVVVITLENRDANVWSQGEEVRATYETLASEFIHDDNLMMQNDKELKVGAQFRDSMAFRQVLRSNAIMNNFGVRFQSSNKSRVIAVCSHRECPWRIRASICPDGQSLEIKRLSSTHLCPGVNRAGNKQATTAWVANEIEEIVRKNPDVTPKDINNTLENMYCLSLPYMKLWRSRKEAHNSIFGSTDDNYRWVPVLQAELISRNPRSYITYTYNEHDLSFQRFYVSFKVCIDGFLGGCRHLIGLDACHLKSKYLGVLLSANSLDGNNGLFTLAFAVAESESKKSWEWFLECLRVSIGFEHHPIAFMSDMEKGLREAIKIIFLNAEHRICVQHLWKNIKRYFNCDDSHKVRHLVWTAANAYTRLEFNCAMDDLLNVCPRLHSYLLGLPYKLLRSDFMLEIKNHYNTNNMSESFNAWIREARSKPAVDLVDMIRGMLMQQRAEQKMISLTWQWDLVPHTEEYIRDISTRNEHFIIRQATSYRAEVEGRGGRYEVDIENKSCGCRW